MLQHYDYKDVGFSVVGESGTDPWTGMKSQRLLESDSTVLQVCVLGLSLQGWNSIQNHPLLSKIETA